MKSFEYAAPSTLKEATALLSDKWGETEILAGGTDLVTSLKQHITTPSRIVSLRNISELKGIQTAGKAVRIGATTTLGDMAHSRHDYEMARTYLTAALASWRALGDEAAVARILNLAGWAAAMQGDLSRARAMLEEALEVAARAGDEGQRSATLHSLGEVARLEGNLTEARALFETLLARRNPLGLLSEDLDPASGELWGNFPQTYSLVGLINSATLLSCRWEDLL